MTDRRDSTVWRENIKTGWLDVAEVCEEEEVGTEDEEEAVVVTSVISEPFEQSDSSAEMICFASSISVSA